MNRQETLVDLFIYLIVIYIFDVQKTIAYQNPKMSKEQRDDLVSNQGHSMTWKRYHRFAGKTFGSPYPMSLINVTRLIQYIFF